MEESASGGFQRLDAETSTVSRACARSQARWRFIQYSGVVEKKRARRMAVSTVIAVRPPIRRSMRVETGGESDRAHPERREIKPGENFAGMQGVDRQAHVRPSQR